VQNNGAPGGLASPRGRSNHAVFVKFLALYSASPVASYNHLIIKQLKLFALVIKTASD